MRIRVPVTIHDPRSSDLEGLDYIRERSYIEEEFFVDGPVSRRVAVVDLDPQSGQLAPGVRLQPPMGGRKLWRYVLDDEDALYARDVIALSVFGTVLRTMYMFEEDDLLGRRLAWGFGGPQLLVIPRAGEGANAFYHKASRSLQFLFFPSPRDADDTVYTALSLDIVSHQTCHAILDGIAPGLYDATTPQSLALHEGVADLAALVMAYRSGSLRQAWLAKTMASGENSGSIGPLAGEPGLADLDPELAQYVMANYDLGYLQSWRNDFGMYTVDHASPHELSKVLSGALYYVLEQMHTSWQRKFSAEGQSSDLSVPSRAMAITIDAFKRMVFRALDYLPPGEVSFTDYGRAILAADRLSHPDDGKVRQWVRDEWDRRGMVSNAEVLEVRTNYAHQALEGVDWQALVASDLAAYQFANQNRRLLRIPSGVSFHVEPRLDVYKTSYHSGGTRRTVRELLFKVRWTHIEPNDINHRWPRQRQISVGTTLVIDWETGSIRVLLTTDRRRSPEEEEEQRRDRDLFLQRLADEDLMRLDNRALDHNGQPLGSFIQAESGDGAMRAVGTARILHIIGER